MLADDALSSASRERRARAGSVDLMFGSDSDCSSQCASEESFKQGGGAGNLPLAVCPSRAASHPDTAAPLVRSPPHPGQTLEPLYRLTSRASPARARRRPPSRHLPYARRGTLDLVISPRRRRL